ncbi:MAG: hypothetical protein LAP87_09185 [Acidobacteriia bacterium]|nr:hypothetical protein [Terriglobia bacterium]
MDVVKIALEFAKVLLSWPVVAIIAGLVFQKQIRSLLEGLRLLLNRVNKVGAFGVSAEVGEKLRNQATPAPQIEAAQTGIQLSVSSGAYSTEEHAILLVASLSNPTDQPDQVVTWRLSFPTLSIELEPASAPRHLIGGVPWWPSPMVKLPPNEIVQGSLYFRGVGKLAEGLPEEPLRGNLTATTLHGKTLIQPVEIYWMSTLQARANAESV